MSLVNNTPRQSIGSGSSINFSNAISGLNSNTTYYFRAVAETQNGTARGVIFSFRTNAPSVVYAMPSVPSSNETQKSSGFAIKKEVENVSFPNGTKSSIAATHGNTIRYSITITNTGSSELGTVKLRDSISDFTEYAESSDGGLYDGISREIVWTLSGIGGGHSKTVTVDVIAKKLPENVVAENTARAQISGYKEKISNSVIAIINTAPLALSILSDEAYLRPGQNFSYEVSYKNEGKSEIKNLRLQIILPGEVEYKGSNDGFNIQDNILHLDLPNLRPGEEGRKSFNASARSSIKDVDTVITTAVMSYFDAFGAAQKNVETYIIHETNSNLSVFGASILSIFPSGPLEWFLAFLCLLAILAIFIVFFKRKESAEAEPLA
jgi:uncharacterized repeat protein (TIGR01451 family)